MEKKYPLVYKSNFFLSEKLRISDTLAIKILRSWCFYVNSLVCLPRAFVDSQNHGTCTSTGLHCHYYNFAPISFFGFRLGRGKSAAAVYEP